MAISKLLPENTKTLLGALPFALAVVWLILFGATFTDLWARWVRWDQDLAHGIPVMALFLYFLWKTGAWSQQSLLPPLIERSITATLLLITSLLWFLAFAVNIQIFEQLLLLPILALSYGLAYGWKTVIQHRILLLFPIFAIPIWGNLNGVLLEAANLVVGELVRFAGMPALIQGNSIFIPYGHILIADGCSGLRYLVVALTMAYLIGYLNGYREGKLLLIMTVAAVLGLITNWVRIFILIVIGYKTQMESSLMADHELFGWLLFGAIFLPAIYFSPVVRKAAPSKQFPAGAVNTKALALAVMVMATGPVLSLVLQSVFSPGKATGELVEVADPADSIPQSRLPVNILAPGGGVTNTQILPGQVFWRQDVYQRERLDQKLVPYLPRLYDHEHWLNPVNRIHNIGPYKVRYQELARKASNERVAQLQWFNVGGYVTASTVEAKLWQVPATLRGQSRFAIVTLQARCRADGCATAKDSLREPARELLDASSSP